MHQSSPTESRSPIGGEATSRVSLHRMGIPPFPSLSARETSRAPASPERRDRPPLDQSGQGRGYGNGSPDFGGGVGFNDDDTYNREHIPESARSQARTPHTPQIPPEDSVPQGCSSQSMEPL